MIDDVNSPAVNATVERWLLAYKRGEIIEGDCKSIVDQLTFKPCPSCGYHDTPSARTMLRRYKAAFRDFPIFAMMKRGWLPGCGFTEERGWSTVEEVRDALKRFFGEDYDDVMMERG